MNQKTLGYMSLAIGLVLMVTSGFSLTVMNRQFLARVPKFPTSLKEGSVIKAEFQFNDHPDVWLMVSVHTWDNRDLNSKWIKPSENSWDFEQLNLVMPAQDVILAIIIKYCEGQPYSDSDFDFAESFSVWIYLDGKPEYPLDYTGYRFKIWGITFQDGNLKVDVEFTPRSPDIGVHAVYAVNYSSFEWGSSQVKIADLQEGRHVYSLAVSDLTHVRFDVYGLRYYVPKEEFGTVAEQPIQQAPLLEQPQNMPTPELSSGISISFSTSLLSIALIICGAFMVLRSRKG